VLFTSKAAGSILEIQSERDMQEFKELEQRLIENR
jgi:hypothetical protein